MSKKERQEFEAGLKNRFQAPKHLSNAKYTKIDSYCQNILKNYYTPNMSSSNKKDYFISNPFNYEANIKLYGEDFIEHFYSGAIDRFKTDENPVELGCLNSDFYSNLHRRSLNNIFIESNDLYNTLLLADISKLHITSDLMRRLVAPLKYEECPVTKFAAYSFFGRQTILNISNKYGVNAEKFNISQLAKLLELKDSNGIMSKDVKVRFRTGFIHIPSSKGEQSVCWLIISKVDIEEKERDFTLWVEYDDYISTAITDVGDETDQEFTEQLSKDEKKAVSEYIKNASEEDTNLSAIENKAGIVQHIMLQQLFLNSLIYNASKTDFVYNNIPLKESKPWLKNTIFLGEDSEFVTKIGTEKCAHYRCGYFKYLGSNFYVNKIGQFVWVRPTYVHKETISGNRKLTESCRTLEED